MPTIDETCARYGLICNGEVSIVVQGLYQSHFDEFNVSALLCFDSDL